MSALAPALGLEPLDVNVPSRLSPEQIVALQSICGEENVRLATFARLRASYGKGLIDELRRVPGEVGAVGVVSVIGHVVADRLAAMVATYSAGDVATAAAINLSLMPVIEGIMTRTQGVIMVKAALDLLERPGGGPLRLPLIAADETQRQQLRQELKAGGFEL